MLERRLTLTRELVREILLRIARTPEQRAAAKVAKAEGLGAGVN
jgi:hypothetical protein